MVSERRIGTDQDKKFVMVVDAENKAAYREIKLGECLLGKGAAHGHQRPEGRVNVSWSTDCSACGRASLLAPTQVSMDGSAERSAIRGAGGEDGAAKLHPPFPD